jgi:hypothetical protein
MRRSLRTTSRSGTLSVLALAMTAALLLGTTSAKATPRGTNGLISYRVYFRSRSLDGRTVRCQPRRLASDAEIADAIFGDSRTR